MQLHARSIPKKREDGMSTKNDPAFTFPPVSKYYFYDWQFAARTANSTALRLIPVILLILSSITDSEKAAFLVVPRPLAFAAVLMMDALLCAFFFCPQFIRQYHDFGQYKIKDHSHRWIVWEFYNNLTTLAGWKHIVLETVKKGVSRDLREFPGGQVKRAIAAGMKDGRRIDTITLYRPINFKRDIYMPIQLENQTVVLYLEEDDPKLGAKEKELFWILLTQAAKEKPYARVIFWVLFFLGAIVGAASIIWALGQAPFA
jgi:hypothetical protein